MLFSNLTAHAFPKAAGLEILSTLFGLVMSSTKHMDYILIQILINEYNIYRCSSKYKINRFLATRVNNGTHSTTDTQICKEIP